MAERKTTRKKQDEPEQPAEGETLTVDKELTEQTLTPDVEIVYREDEQPMEKPVEE